MTRRPTSGGADDTDDVGPSDPLTSPDGGFVVRCAEDLLAAVPAALGFLVHDSVVLLTFGAPAGAFHARVDVPRDPDEIAVVVDTLVQAVRRNRPAHAAVVVYDPDPDLGREIGSGLVPALLATGTDVVDVLQVDDGLWWPVPVGDPTELVDPRPFDLRDHPLTAQGVFAGRRTFATREELEASLRPADDAVAARFAVRVDARLARLDAELDGTKGEAVATHEREWLERVAAEAPVTRSPVSDPDAARVVALARVAAVRDHYCLGLTRQRAVEHLDLWRGVVARAPAAVVAGAAAVLALVAWLAGDGALAWCAVDRCLEAEPDNTLAAHVAAALQGAVPPAAWESPHGSAGGTPSVGLGS